MAISKKTLRASARVARSSIPDKNARSEAIHNRLVRFRDYRSATNVGFYVDVRDEVRTRSLLSLEFDTGVRSIFVPYCDGSMLRFCRIKSMSELDVGRFGLLEPCAKVRESLDRRVAIANVETLLVPGVAFTRQGDRVGYGAGFYDRCLATSTGTTKIALAFDCQIVETIPADSFDVKMDYICTENELIECNQN